MARTYHVELLNEGVLNLLRDMELMKLIKLTAQSTERKIPGKRLVSKYKGALSSKSLEDTDSQLRELRDGWE
jgi:hypothetical protein